jgi:hypothetical protein
MSFISTKKDFLDKYTSYGYSTDKELLIDTIHTEEFPHLKGKSDA